VAAMDGSVKRLLENLTTVPKPPGGRVSLEFELAVDD